MDCNRLTKQDMDLLRRSDLFQDCAPQAVIRAANDPQCELWEVAPGSAAVRAGAGAAVFLHFAFRHAFGRSAGFGRPRTCNEADRGGRVLCPSALFHDHDAYAVEFNRQNARAGYSPFPSRFLNS